jgi:hypothetical protein
MSWPNGIGQESWFRIEWQVEANILPFNFTVAFLDTWMQLLQSTMYYSLLLLGFDKHPSCLVS